MKQSTDKGTLWFLISSAGIGGSERRIVKVATHVADRGVFSRVNLLVNRKLRAEYAKDVELSALLNTSPVHLMTKECLLEKCLLPDVFKIMLIKRVHRYLRDFQRFYSWVLQSLSWSTLLSRLTNEEDMLHCFFGDPARNGCLFLAIQSNRRILLEITSNRHLDRLADQMSTILDARQARSTLRIRCVSRTVYVNLTSLLPHGFFKGRNVDLNYYSAPFVDQKSGCEERPKEKVIIFPHRFIGPKNPILFCRVIRRLLDEGRLQGWKIKLRGRGGLEGEMKDILKPYIERGIVDIGFSYELGKEFAESIIFVSIIVTGTTTSQSLFEAMRCGNLLVLSRSGENEQKFQHPEVFFVDLNEESLAQGLLQAVATCESEAFQEKSESMRAFFRNINENAGYISDVLRIYQC